MKNISPALLENYRSALIGRLKLKLFYLISGEENVAPTQKQLIAYAEQAARKHYDWGEMIAGFITSDRCQFIDNAALATDLNIDELFAKLDRYPMDVPLFLEVKDPVFGYPVGAWISCQKLKDIPGHFYILQMVSDETFPDTYFQYMEVRVSQQEPEPAFCYFNAKGEYAKETKHSPTVLENDTLLFGLQLLEYISRKYKSPFIGIPQIIENNWQAELDYKNRPIDDLYYFDLTKQLIQGKIKASVAFVPIEHIRPFSYQECFDLPLFEIEHGLSVAEKFNEQGLMVYYKDGFFVTSDDYIHYMALRIQKTAKVKVIIMGEAMPADIQIVKRGGPELMTPVLFSVSPVSKRLSAELNDNILEDFLDQLRMVNNSRNLINVNCIVLTEDKHTDMLENLLLSCGFDTDHVRIMSYEGCTNTGALPMIVATLQQIRQDMLFIVHRDGDYLTPAEASEYRQKVQKLNLVPFVTAGTDIESYYLNPAHINYLYPTVDLKEIEQMIKKQTLATKTLSLERMRKHQYKKDYNGPAALNDQEIAKNYETNPVRFRLGKKTLGLLKSDLQKKLGNNAALNRPSPFLTAPELVTAAKKVAKQL